MVSDGHTRSRCDLNMDLQMTEFLIPNCFRRNVSDGGSTDERSNCIRMYIVLDCEYCNIICYHLYLRDLLFACSKFPFSLGLTLHSLQNGFRRIIFMPLCHWVVVSVTQPLNKHPSSSRVNKSGSDIESPMFKRHKGLDGIPMTPNASMLRRPRPMKQRGTLKNLVGKSYTAGAEKCQIPHFLDEYIDSGALSCTLWLRWHFSHLTHHIALKLSELS